MEPMLSACVPQSWLGYWTLNSSTPWLVRRAGQLFVTPRPRPSPSPQYLNISSQEADKLTGNEGMKTSELSSQ